MAENRKKRRRTILAEKGAQIQVISWFFIHLFIYILLTLTVILLPSVLRLTTEGIALEEQFAASQEFLLLDLRVVPVLLAMTLLGGVHLLFLTHRIFGPLVRLRGALRRWRDGNWPPAMHVRRHDFHGPLFDEFSLSASALGEDVAAARELVGRAAERAQSLATPAGAEKPGQAAQAVVEDCRLALERLDRWQR